MKRRRSFPLVGGDTWTDGKRTGVVLGGAAGRVVQIRLASGLCEFSERYFLRRFRPVKPRRAS